MTSPTFFGGSKPTAEKMKNENLAVPNVVGENPQRARDNINLRKQAVKFEKERLSKEVQKKGKKSGLTSFKLSGRLTNASPVASKQLEGKELVKTRSTRMRSMLGL